MLCAPWMQASCIMLLVKTHRPLALFIVGMECTDVAEKLCSCLHGDLGALGKLVCDVPEESQDRQRRLWSMSVMICLLFATHAWNKGIAEACKVQVPGPSHTSHTIGLHPRLDGQ